jgi:hypothetical protein
MLVYDDPLVTTHRQEYQAHIEIRYAYVVKTVKCETWW